MASYMNGRMPLMSTLRSRVLALTVLVLVLTTAAGAQQQVVRPPVAQLWIDLATNTIAAPGGLRLPSFGGENRFGNTRFAFGRYMDVALAVRTRPQGIQATQSIPQGMRMGASLPLDPFRAAPPAPGGPGDPSQVEQPKGRILFYWGCSTDVRSGQPRIIDVSRATPQEWASVFAGRYAPERGATAEAGRSIWPNDRDKRMLPDGNSVQGEHAIAGDSVPAGFRFMIGQAQDIMPAIELSPQGDPEASVTLQWRAIPTARAYFISAFGAKGSDFIIWSSSELPEAGMGVLDYLSNANIERWTGERVLLSASATRCAVPRGIFAGTDGAIARMIAYGAELNLVQPPRPTDPRTPWEQQWAVRVRVKSTVMTVLGQ